MERESDENLDRRPGRRHGREHAPAAGDEAELELEQESVPLEDTGRLPGEGAAVDDV